MLVQIEMFVLSVHTCARYSPLVKTAVYDGVVHCRAHGKQKDCEINLLNVLLLVDVFLEAPQDEVDVIGQPADSKNDHNYHHGLHKLEKQNLCVISGALCNHLSLLGEYLMLPLFWVWAAVAKKPALMMETGNRRELERIFPAAPSGLSAEELLAGTLERRGRETWDLLLH